MHLATVAAVTLAVLSTACTIVVQAEPADDESESTSTTVAASSFPEQAESSSSRGELEDSSSTGREIGSTGEAEVGGETSTGDDTTGEIVDDTGGESSSTGDDSTSSSTSGDDDSSTGVTAKAYGESCEANADCDSGLCHAGSCTVACTQAVANDCGGLGVPGLCIELYPEIFGCAGDLTFGDDPDDARLTIASDGDFLVRSFQSANDADLFLLDLPAGVYSIDAAPVVDVDVQLELYDDQAAELGVISDTSEGLPEAVEVDHTGGVLFVVVRSVGQQTGDHTFHFVTK